MAGPPGPSPRFATISSKTKVKGENGEIKSSLLLIRIRCSNIVKVVISFVLNEGVMNKFEKLS